LKSHFLCNIIVGRIILLATFTPLSNKKVVGMSLIDSSSNMWIFCFVFVFVSVNSPLNESMKMILD
jgi:hypothetical protein